MAEKMLTVRMSEQEYRALKLYAVLHGRSVNAVLLELIRSELVHEAASRIGQGLRREVTLLVPALSLAVASHECGGELPELDHLMSGDADLVLLVPLTRESAVDVGAASSTPRGEDLESAHVVWCASGHEEDGEPASRRPVATYWPDLYAKSGVPIIAL